MAKKKRVRTESAAKHDLVKACAFFGILISAILFVVGAIMNWCGLGNITYIFNLIASIALLIAVAFPAWDYVKYRGKAWRILYWVVLIIYIFGCVFGMIKFWI